LFELIIAIVTLLLKIIVGLSLIRSKDNSRYGIKTRMMMVSDESRNYGKVVAGKVTLPFIVIQLIIVVFANPKEAKLWFTIGSLFLWIITIAITYIFSVQKHLKKRREKEQSDYQLYRKRINQR